MTVEAADDRGNILCIYFLPTVAIHVAEKELFFFFSDIWANNVFMYIKDRGIRRSSIWSMLEFDLPSPWI